VVAVWNLVDPGTTGSTKTIQLAFHGVAANAKVSISRVDDEHGNTLAAYKALGSPLDPTEAQVKEMNRKTDLGPAEQGALSDGKLDLSLESNALVLVTVGSPAVGQHR
jgi:xylan 1,4-beta-xylosidase